MNGKRFYRPGEAGHPAYRPTSAEWKRRHGEGQNAIVKGKAKKHTTPAAMTAVSTATTPAIGPRRSEQTSQISSSEVRSEQAVEEANSADNVLNTETYDKPFHDSELAQQEGEEEKEAHGPLPMKFYRPGDPDHQAVRPITDRFKRKYAAMEGLNKIQNELVQVSFCQLSSRVHMKMNVVQYD